MVDGHAPGMVDVSGAMSGIRKAYETGGPGQLLSGARKSANKGEKMAKTKKSLILYASQTGNTEKVANRFKEVFTKKGWRCDMVKVDRNTDVWNPPFKFGDYDFLCIGSPVILGLPTEEIINVMIKNPESGHYGEPTREEVARLRLQRNDPDYLPRPEHPKGEARPPRGPAKTIPGPKKGIVFVTYSGMHLGPKEAEAALSLLDIEIEHLRFKCIGRFCCPGKHGNHAGAGTWHGDIRKRPNERDLLKAQIFLEDILDEL
jgi:hypothetical protein